MVAFVTPEIDLRDTVAGQVQFGDCRDGRGGVGHPANLPAGRNVFHVPGVFRVKLAFFGLMFGMAHLVMLLKFI